MMNSIIFSSKVIYEKQNFTAKDIADLKEITEKYPYFQLAAMLYSKALLKTKNYNYKKVLAKTATIVNNREQLFSYLYCNLYTADNSQDVIKKPIDKPDIKIDVKAKPIIKPAEEKIVETKTSNNSNFISTTKIQKPKPIISDGKEIKDKKDLMQTIAKNLNKATTEAKNTEVAATKAVKVETTKVEVKSTDTPVPEVEATQVKPVEEKEETETIEVSVTAANNETIKAETIEVKAVTKVSKIKPITTPKAEAVEAPKVKAVPKKTKIVTAKTDNESIEVKNSIPKKKTKTVKSTATSAKAKAIKKTKVEVIIPVDRKTSITIMEKFIKNDPSINKPEDKAYSKELAIAKSSVREDYNIVSETIANLYATQGNIKKAKKVYEKLILIYPEKITYFAARISELK